MIVGYVYFNVSLNLVCFDTFCVVHAVKLFKVFHMPMISDCYGSSIRDG